MSDPRVSVLVLACDRERYVGAALESALAQRTRFPFEIVVGLDACRDRTPEIVREHAGRFAGRFEIVAHERNVGMVNNCADALERCRAPLVAILEDDDVWTSPEKLELQVDHFDAHPGRTLCFHDARHFWEDGSAPEHGILFPGGGARIGFDELAVGALVPTSSTMLRRDAVTPLPDWFRELWAHEWALHLLAASRGSIGYVDRVLLDKRIHPQGDWVSRGRLSQLEMFVHDLEVIERGMPAMRRPTTDIALARDYYWIARIRLRRGDLAGAWQAARRSLARRTTRPRRGTDPRLVLPRSRLVLMLRILLRAAGGAPWRAPA
jgi:glycosyltransferase involved in cell wall biosynthesis